MMMPNISVIIVVKNGEKFLAQAIESVLVQTYQNLEIIVIVGASTDNTLKIAQSFENIEVVVQKDVGIASAYNLGVQTSRGKFVTFLSHDDIWEPTKLENQFALIMENPTIQCVVGRVKFFVSEGEKIPYGFRKDLLNDNRVAFIPETLFARKELFDFVGYFDPTLVTGEDVDWFSRVFDANIEIAFVDEIILKKRVHSGNSSLLDVGRNNKYLLEVARRSITRKRNFVRG
jgi:glycosyltransferase involved in cell wall biosynthesis